MLWRDEAIPGGLFDFALYYYHNYLLAKGSGPYFYLPKTQSREEAAGGAMSSALPRIVSICRAAPSKRPC